MFWRVLVLCAGALLFLSEDAFAQSAGCLAANNTTYSSAQQPNDTFAIGVFQAGDQITIEIVRTFAGSQAPFQIETASPVIPFGTFLLNQGVFVFPVPNAVTNPTTVNLRNINFGGDFTVYNMIVYCTAAPKSNTSSNLIDLIRQQFSKLAASTSSSNTGESVTSAITDAFNGGGSTQANGSRISTSFAAIENDAVAREAFAALGYAKGTVMKAPPPRIAPSPWHAWIDARYTALDDKRVSTFDAHHTNITGGISYRFNEYFLAGLVTGYENFDYELGFRNGKLDGNGWNAGGYFGWRFWDRLRLDGMLTWGKINYGAQADNATGSFDADRVTSMLRLSGRYGLAANWYIEPSGRLIYAREKQDAFTDTAGVLHPNYSFNVGLASFGGEVGAPTIWGSWIVTPSIGLFGDYRFGTDNALAVATLPNLNDGWSARVTGNLRWSAPNGFIASVGGQYGGLGSDTPYWQAKGSLGIKF